MAGATGPSEAAAGTRVLVVDDDVGILDIMEELLASQGYEVLRAESGEAALAAVATGAPLTGRTP